MEENKEVLICSLAKQVCNAVRCSECKELFGLPDNASCPAEWYEDGDLPDHLKNVLTTLKFSSKPIKDCNPDEIFDELFLMKYLTNCFLNETN